MLANLQACSLAAILACSLAAHLAAAYAHSYQPLGDKKVTLPFANSWPDVPAIQYACTHTLKSQGRVPARRER